MSEVDKKLIKRMDLDNSAFLDDEIKAYFNTGNIKVIKLENEIINNIEYYKIIRLAETQVEGTVYHNDLKSIFESVKYDIYSSFNAYKLALGIQINYSNNFVAIYFILSLIYTIVVYTVPITIYRYVILKHIVIIKKVLQTDKINLENYGLIENETDTNNHKAILSNNINKIIVMSEIIETIDDKEQILIKKLIA
jgi:hypothetical protein